MFKQACHNKHPSLLLDHKRRVKALFLKPSTSNDALLVKAIFLDGT